MITRKQLFWDNLPETHKLFQYKIDLGDGRKGDAQLIIEPLSYRIGKAVYEVLLGENIQPTNTLAHLNEFYPNGRGLDERSSQFMRNGNGSRVFDHLLREARKFNARATYVFTGKESMQRFLKKMIQRSMQISIS